MHIDDLIEFLTQRWTFKLMIFVILSLPSFQYFGQFQNILLALVKPEFKCIQNITEGIEQIDPSQCTIRNILTNATIPCTTWKFSNKPVGRTMISDYQLVCNKDYFNQLIIIFWYSSALLSPVQGWLTDKYGRKNMAIFNLSLETIVSLLLIFSPNLWSNIVLRVLLGISSSGVFITFTWISEMVDKNFRAFIGSFFWMFGCLAYMIIPLVFYLTRDWRLTQGYCLIPSILYLLILFVPESPRWLYAVGDIKGTIRSLETIGRINKLDKSIKIGSMVRQQLTSSEIKKDDLSLYQSFKSTNFTKYLVVLFYLQCSAFMFYSGTQLNLTILHNDIFVSMLLAGSMELPGLILSFLSLKYMSRRIVVILLSLVGSILFLATIFFDKNVDWQSITRVVIGCIARISIATLFQIQTAYAAELLPTSHRTFGMATLQLANCVAIVSAVYINQLEKLAFFLPVLIYSIQLWIGCIAVYFVLPDTRNFPIPESVQDQKMLQLGYENKYLEYMHNKRSELDAVIMTDNNDNEKLPFVKYCDNSAMEDQ